MRSLILATLLLAAGTAGAAEICQPSNPAYFHKYFAGKIDGRHAFKMDLTCKDGFLNGSYRYATKGVPISLNGQIGPGMAVSIGELSPNGYPGTGAFTGAFDGKHFRGTWMSADGKRRFPFTAEQTSEIHIGTRREIMQAAVGDYVLASVFGTGGANAIWETVKAKNGWQSNVSSISLGRREESYLDLTRAEQHLLGSLAIRVRPDLVTELSANGKVVLTVPFRADGMQLAIESPDNAQASDELATLVGSNGIADEQLYLLAQDGGDYHRMMGGQFAGELGDIVIVRYAIVNDSFEVQFKLGDCCDNSRFSFHRRQPVR